MPGSLEFQAEQRYLQPPERQTDVVDVIKGVIEGERGAIEQTVDEVDWVTPGHGHRDPP